MRKMMMLAAASGLMMTATARAQDAQPMAAPADAPMTAPADAPMAGMMTPEQVGVGVMMGTPSPSYVMWAANSDMYEIQSSKLALSKAKSDQTKDFAREMIADHMTTTKSLMAALPNTDPKVPKPGKAMSEDNVAKIAALKAASADDFDAMYMQQQMQAHQAAWSLHKGYSQDGADPALKQAAMSAVPIIEKHLAAAKAGPGMKTM